MHTAFRAAHHAFPDAGLSDGLHLHPEQPRHLDQPRGALPRGGRADRRHENVNTRHGVALPLPRPPQGDAPGCQRQECKGKREASSRLLFRFFFFSSSHLSSLL